MCSNCSGTCRKAPHLLTKCRGLVASYQVSPGPSPTCFYKAATLSTDGTSLPQKSAKENCAHGPGGERKKSWMRGENFDEFCRHRWKCTGAYWSHISHSGKINCSLSAASNVRQHPTTHNFTSKDGEVWGLKISKLQTATIFIAWMLYLC